VFAKIQRIGRAAAVAASIAAFALFVQPAQAASVPFGLDTEFSGATPPAGSPFWLLATFDDGGTAGSVSLSIDAAGLTGTEFVSEFYFNFDGDPTTLTIAEVTTGADASTAPSATVSTGTDSFKADGDGSFDVLLEYPTSGDRFTSGELSNWLITGTGIVADDFLALSFVKGGDKEGLFVAAHIQGIGDDGADSGWITGTVVPLPAALPLFLTGLAGLGLLGWLRRRAGVA